MQAAPYNCPLVLHGVFLAIFNKGVLLTGPSGSGKSDCALQLISRQHQLIADDAPLFHREGNKIIGKCPPPLKDLLEIRALGIVDVTMLFGKQATLPEKELHLIIQFTSIASPTTFSSRRLAPQLENRMIFDIPVPHLTVELALCQNTAILIESAVQLVFAHSPSLSSQG